MTRAEHGATDLTVIMCTYNRAANLPAAIAHLERQRDCEDLDWELLVVDNNSTDDTRQVVHGLMDSSHIRIRYEFEAQQGLSYARNRGMRAATGRILVFIDDDILVSERWLASIFACFRQYDCDAAGGRIHLPPEVHVPAWVTGDMHGFLGYQDYGEEPFQIGADNRYPFGGNMAFHRRVIDRIGLFDHRLGRKGEGRRLDELFKGEESDYFQRLKLAGGSIRYEPGAVVFHQVKPHQLKQDYFLTIHYGAGMQRARFDTASYRRRLHGVPLFVFMQLVRAALRYSGQLFRLGPDRAFRQKMNVWYFAGMVAGYWGRGRGTAAAA